jgi:hypothetical protein
MKIKKTVAIALFSSALFGFTILATPALAQHTVTLSWTASVTSGVTYNVYRQQACSGNFAQINSSAVTATAFTDSAVAPGETYCYQVTASLSGVESTVSSPASATIPAAPPQSLTSPANARTVCTRRGTFFDWAKCVASLPRKGK